ncbi:MAG TPA: Dps family protein [Vicinamibacteria bacterium]|nr:Dps family protein [Vicinamibacteria bacterium]
MLTTSLGSTGARPMDIGIDPAHRRAVADGLTRLLADSHALRLKTQSYSWNVTGPMFPTLHRLFRRQHRELARAVDAVAERIRALGHPVPGGPSAYAKLSSVSEATGCPGADEMVRELLEGQEAVVHTAREALPAAEQANDRVSADLIARRLRVHEKSAWMLRALLA